MGTLFEDAAAAHSRAIDTTFSERWLYQPFTVAAGEVNGRPSPDPDRWEREIVGVFIDPYARAASGEVRKQGVKPERPGHQSTRMQLDLDVTQLPYRVRTGDRVIRRKTGKTYHLAEPKFPSHGPRWQLDLNEI